MLIANSAVGVDACPAGWFATILTEDRVEADLFEDFSTLHEKQRGARIFVDIPIGLPSGSRRACDIEARRLLGCRGSSVFYPPCEAAATTEDYDAANEKHRDVMDYGLSRQAHAIRENILEVQAVVGETYDGPVYESHPELCFYALNGQPIAYSKSSARGLALRLHLLETKRPGMKAVYERVLNETYRKDIRRDDILDSMVLAIAARSEELRTAPEEPTPDAPRIYYPQTGALEGRAWSVL